MRAELLEPDHERERRDLERTWEERGRAMHWLGTVDHKKIGRRFIVTAFGFFGGAGVLAAIMRLQLARPENDLVTPDLYNQIFTMHGTTMMFLFAVPVMLGVGIYIVPLMVGARSIAFPRLLAFAYWMFLFGGLFLWVMFLGDVGPDNGWFSYTPLSGPEYGIGKRQDVWSQFITFSELASILVAVSLATTILKMRTPGMSLHRMPVYVWGMLVVSVMIIFSLPSVMLASTSLILDRLVGTHFFNQADGGDPLLWQHLFWFFAHPEVYIIFLPGAAMLSTLVSTFTRRPLFGYMAVVLSLVTTGFIGFGVWVHHMFATGLPQLGTSFFTAASMMISVPTGVQFFCWLATLWTGRIVFSTPMLYVLGFLVVFLIGGLTGVMLAAVPLNLQVHDTFFVVAHLHYVLIGGALFPLLGAIVYWFPKLTGRLMNERAGRWAFWLFFVGFNVTFFPMHQLGLYGMPRRVYTYAAGMGWGGMNLLATAGAGILTLALVIFFLNALISRRRGEIASDNPWNASTLEWATSSPPPAYNFHPAHSVRGRDPLWSPAQRGPAVIGLATDKREALISRVTDAEPDNRHKEPAPSKWPFAAAIAVSVFFIWSIFTPWALVYMAVPMTVTLVGWFWPKEGKPPREVERDIREGRATPLEATK